MSQAYSYSQAEVSSDAYALSCLHSLVQVVVSLEAVDLDTEFELRFPVQSRIDVEMGTKLLELEYMSSTYKYEF